MTVANNCAASSSNQPTSSTTNVTGGPEVTAARRFVTSSASAPPRATTKSDSPSRRAALLIEAINSAGPVGPSSSTWTAGAEAVVASQRTNTDLPKPDPPMAATKRTGDPDRSRASIRPASRGRGTASRGPPVCTRSP